MTMSDERYARSIKANREHAKPVDDLVSDFLDLNRNEPDHGEDGVLDDYQKLRARLNRALDLVNEELKRRNG